MNRIHAFFVVLDSDLNLKKFLNDLRSKYTVIMRCKNDEISGDSGNWISVSGSKTSYFLKSVHQNAHVDVCVCVCVSVFVRVRKSIKHCVKIASVSLKFQHLLAASYGCSDIIRDLIGPNGARGAMSTAASSEGSPT